MTNKLDGQSMNIEQMEMDKLRSVFPQCFVEGRLDIDKLLSLCGEYIDKDFEKYKFEWKGKAKCLRIAQQRSMGTLRPCQGESVNFDTTQNLYIEGDNLEVLKLLQTAYYRKVKMIYIDPPYNTGNDFVYEDDFADPMARYKEVTGQTTKSNPETMGRFHTNWLNMMYPRLRLAANLLRDDGVIFISIDDNEVRNLRFICDEVFGEENFVAEITIASNSSKNNSKYISVTHEYILCYAKSKLNLGEDWSVSRNNLEEYKNRISTLRKAGLTNTEIRKELLALTKYPRFYEFDHYTYVDKKGAFRASDLTAPSSKNFYDVIHPETNKPCKTGIRGWAYSQEAMQSLIDEDMILWGKDETIMPQLKNYLCENEMTLPKSVLFFDSQSSTKWIKAENLPFDFAKSIDLIKYILETCTTGGDIILDFFSGSATTAHAVMQLNAEDGGNRKFICIQLPEVTDEKSEAYKAGYKNICEIGKERIRRAGKKLSETDEQIKLGEEQKTIDTGFKVFKLDTSNLKTWDSSFIGEDNLLELTNRMNNMMNTIKPDRSDLDMVYEIMLKMGIPLTYSVTQVNIGGKTAYSIGDECLLLICLQVGITTEIIEQIAEEYIPSKIILSEKCFADDTALSNAHYVLKDRKIELKLV